MSKRTILIGDLHGCLEEFRDLIDRLAVTADDRVVCLGDFLDKGPFPVECVQFARTSGFDAVLGNHEEKALRWLRHQNRAKLDPEYKNPIRLYDDRYSKEYEALTSEDVAWLGNLPGWIRINPEWVAVHAGFLPGLTLEQQPLDKVLRVRWVDEKGKNVSLMPDDPEPKTGSSWMEAYDGDLNVVYGHATHSFSRPRVDIHARPNGRQVVCLGIDTGCVYGGNLTALVLPSEEIVQVPARKRHSLPHFPLTTD